MPLDYPEQTYRPSWKVRLTIRLEEFASGVLARKVPTVPTKNLKGVKVDRAPLVASPDPDFPGRFLLKPKVTRATLDDAIKNYVISDSSSDGLTQVITGVIPKKFDWRQNGFRTADELKCSLRWCDFPIDPRVVRACAVEFFLGTLTATEYAQGMRGLTRGDVFGNSAANAHEPMNVVPDGYLDRAGNRRSNLRFTGWVDKWKMSWNEEEPCVELECRDNTMLLLGQNAPPQLVLGMKDPIDLAIANYLSNFPQFAGLTVEYRGTPGDAVPKLAGTLAGTAFRPHLGPQPGQGAGDDLVVWDYLTDIAGSIGHVIRIDGNAIIIQRAATLLHGDVSARNDDPYKGRSLSSGDYPARAFVYGRNVQSFEVARDMANGETKNIEVRCFPGDTVISATGIQRGYRRFYAGPVITVRSGPEGGRVFTGTPNHPVLTRRGWIALEDLAKGDHLICCDIPQRRGFADPDVDAAPTKFIELFDALADSGRMERRPARDMNFHGDGEGSDVDIVRTDLLLEDGFDTSSSKHRIELAFKAAGDAEGLLKCSRSRDEGSLDPFARDRSTANGDVCGFGKGRALLAIHAIETVSGGLLETSDLDASGGKGAPQDAGTDACFSSDSTDCLTFEVTTSEVIEVERGLFSGHVFNLQTASGWYTASGVVAHNCYSSRRKQVLVARFPRKADRIACSTPGDARADNKWTIVRVSGIENPLVLQQIAEDVFHGRNRNEIEVAIKTINLASFGGDNEDPDILDIKSGDAVEVLVDRASAGTAADTEAKLTAHGANEEHLKGLGYSAEFSAAYAKVYENAAFQRFYRVKEMSTTGDVDAGVAFEIRACNFIQARGDIPPTAAPPPPNAGSSASQGGGKTSPTTPQPQAAASKVAVTDAGGKAIKGVTSSGGITVIKKASQVK